MDIPMASGLGRGFSSKLPAIPMRILMASGLGKGASLEDASYSDVYSYG